MIEERSRRSDGDDRHADPLFDLGEENRDGVEIFARKELLEEEHVPESARIVGRDEEIEAVATELRPVIEGEPPNDLTIYGETGTGKSLVARHVTERVRRAAEAQGVSVGTVYVDCAQYDTHTHVTRIITRSLNDEEATGFSIPADGLGTEECHDYLWEFVDEQYDIALVVFDEIDRLEDDDPLMQLSRARESGKTDCRLGIIAISNEIEYRDCLNERVESGPREGEEFAFQPYDASRLCEILNHRRDAFRDGVLTEEVIPLTATFAARERGDARKAIGILRRAGELAERRADERVTETHVREARERAEMDRFEETLREFFR